MTNTFKLTEKEIDVFNRILSFLKDADHITVMSMVDLYWKFLSKKYGFKYGTENLSNENYSYFTAEVD
jgi:predicted RNA methylase